MIKTNYKKLFAIIGSLVIATVGALLLIVIFDNQTECVYENP